MEPRLGHDLSDVRVHRGHDVTEAADRLRARAFTVGSDIWLGRGAHEHDRRLMGHELAHVVQHRGPAAGAGTRLQRTAITDGFLTFQTAPRFLTSDYTVGDAAVRLLQGTARYSELMRDLRAAFRAVYGEQVPAVLYQYAGIPSNDQLCGGDTAGCCRNCDENCQDLGIAAPDQFVIYAELFDSGWPSGLRTPSGFRVTVRNSPEVATASIMYHELLHLWFYQFLCMHREENRDHPSGHNGGYDPDFARMWQEAHTQIEARHRARGARESGSESPRESDAFPEFGPGPPTGRRLATPPRTPRELQDAHDDGARRRGLDVGLRLEVGGGLERNFPFPAVFASPIIWAELGLEFARSESSRVRWLFLARGFGSTTAPVGGFQVGGGVRIFGGALGSTARPPDTFFVDLSAGVLYRMDLRPGVPDSGGVGGRVGLGYVWTVGDVELDFGARVETLYHWNYANPGSIIVGLHSGLRF